MGSPQWSSLPAPRPVVHRRSWAPVLAPLALVALLWLLGARTLAVLVAVVAAVMTVATALSPGVRSIVERAMGWIGRTVGTVLTYVLLGFVQLVIFAPAALWNRLTRADPMDPLAGAQATSRWLTRTPSNRDLENRQYGDEAYRRTAAGGVAPVGSPRWIRAAVGGLVLLLAADVVVGSLLVWLDRDDDAETTDLTVFSFDPTVQEALATQINGRPLMEQLGGVGIGEADPFMGWRFPPDKLYETEFVNIRDGLRVTSESAVPGPRAEVWFFGGSTIYGSGQSDAATIPSALVAQLDANGIGINATNFGHPAYANWQQVQLLEAELTAGTRPPPDLVVFYDGFNDLTLQTQRGVHTEPTHLFADRDDTEVAADTETVFATVRTWWADHSATALAVGRVADLFGDDEPAIQLADVDAAPIDTIDPLAAADAAVAIHRRGVDHVVALGTAYGFDTRFFWQPFLYTRDPLTPAETDLVGLPGYDVDVWVPMTERVRAQLADPIIDLSDVLDDEPSSLFWDFVHTNERGAALVAESMLPAIADALVG